MLIRVGTVYNEDGLSAVASMATVDRDEKVKTKSNDLFSPTRLV